jgi:hypothetical protein
VLQGVAVYTWNGSSWTPAGGAPGSATPTGVLRGVAAFSWDGTAWQPAAQAGPDVATPFGVLQGVAMFNWSGTAWAPSAGIPAGATLSLNFMTSTLDPLLTFTRASTGTYFDSGGVMRTAAANAPRWDYASGALRGLLLEEARTNLLFPSVPDSGAKWTSSGPIARGGSIVAPDGTTSTISLFSASDTTNAARSILAAGTPVSATTSYTVSVFLKSGPNNAYIQVNINGSATAVPIAYYDLTNGTAVVGADLVAGATGLLASISPAGGGWYRARFSFTTNVGATGIAPYIGPCVTVLATGDNRSYPGVVGQGIYVWGAQCEQAAYPTSHIPTISVAVARSADSCVVSPANMSWFTAGPGSWFAEFIHQTTPTPSAPRIIGYPVASGKTPLFVSATRLASVFDGNAVVAAVGTVPVDTVAKATSAWSPSTGKICLNGGAVASGAETTGFLDAATTGVALFRTGTVVESSTGYIRRVAWWPRVLSDAEMQQVTT